MDHAHRAARASPAGAQGRGRRSARHRHRAQVRDRPAGASDAGTGQRRAGPQPALRLHQPARWRGGAGGRGAGRAVGDRDLASALLRHDDRMEPGAGRCADLAARRGAQVGDAAGPGDPLLGGRHAGARARADAAASRRPFRGRAGAALGGRRRRPGRAARRRHPAGGDGPPLRQLHVQLPQLHPAAGGDRAAHGRRCSSPTPSSGSTAPGSARWCAPTARRALRRSAERYVRALESG